MFPLSHMLKSFVRTGTLEVIDADGRSHMFAGAPDGPRVTMRLTDRSLYHKLFLNPELNAGEAYMDGRLSFENSTLRDFLTLFSINRLSLGSHPMQKVMRRVGLLLKRFQQANPVGKAQKNVAHHYDLGNDFYKLFLDAGMQYSCAYFLDDNETLEQAQQNKLRLIAAKLALRPGLKILDIGSGWGDMALYLAQLENVDVTGVTLSKEQHALSNEKAKRLGLADRVRFRLQDYREVPERFDRIVSVGMFEHVGVHHYGEFFAKVNALMHDDGVMLLHSIGHMSPPGTASPWLRKYIFPGAYSPALSEVFTAVEQASLWVTDLEISAPALCQDAQPLVPALRGQPREDRRDVRRALLPHVGVLSRQRRDDVPHRQPARLPHAACPQARCRADRARLRHRPAAAIPGDGGQGIRTVRRSRRHRRSEASLDPTRVLPAACVAAILQSPAARAPATRR